MFPIQILRNLTRFFSSSYLSKAGITTSNQPVSPEQSPCLSPKTKLSGSTDFDFGILINNSTDQGNVSQSQKKHLNKISIWTH